MKLSAKEYNQVKRNHNQNLRVWARTRSASVHGDNLDINTQAYRDNVARLIVKNRHTCEFTA